jgi:mycothiol synthase
MTTLASLLPPPLAQAGSELSFRRWQGIEDIAGMAAAGAALRSRVGVVQLVDTEAMRHHYTHLVNSDPATDCILVARDDTTLGYARVEWHDLADGDRTLDIISVVDPEAWGMGVAEALLRWTELRAAQLALEHPSERTTHLTSFAFQGDVELTTALEALGYVAVRWDAEMLRPDMADIPDVELAEGYHLRAPEEAELPAVHQMMVEGFAEHWGEYEAEDHRIEDWLEDPRFRRDLVVVAWAGPRPASLVCNIVETAADGVLRGLLDAVVTHPDHRRRGLARAAIARSLQLLHAEGVTSAYLGVDTDNHNRALALYGSCGFRVVSTSTTYRRPMPGTENPT